MESVAGQFTKLHRIGKYLLNYQNDLKIPTSSEKAFKLDTYNDIQIAPNYAIVNMLLSNIFYS